MRLYSPAHGHHGYHVNRYACGSGEHSRCTGFSGGYDTYICGCCCHDEERGVELTDEDLTIIRRVRAEAS